MTISGNYPKEGEVALIERLHRLRWPAGFVCPSCGGRRAWPLQDRLPAFQCVRCDTQCSLTSGTIMHGTKLPLSLWAQAARLMTTSNDGIDPRGLQKELGLASYTTALRLHRKLSSALKALGRRPRGAEDLLIQLVRRARTAAKGARPDPSPPRRW